MNEELKVGDVVMNVYSVLTEEGITQLPSRSLLTIIYIGKCGDNERIIRCVELTDTNEEKLKYDFCGNQLVKADTKLEEKYHKLLRQKGLVKAYNDKTGMFAKGN